MTRDNIVFGIMAITVGMFLGFEAALIALGGVAISEMFQNTIR